MRSIPKCLLALFVALLAGPRARAAQEGVLWSIGTRDDSTAEFAHAPSDYRAYRQPACFAVGSSDPAKDWPYVQPGPSDGGASSEIRRRASLQSWSEGSAVRATAGSLRLGTGQSFVTNSSPSSTTQPQQRRRFLRGAGGRNASVRQAATCPACAASSGASKGC